MKDEFTDGGKTELDWVKAFFDSSDLPKLVDWEDLRPRRATTSSTLPEHYKSTPALRWFAEGRACDTPDPSNPEARHRQGPRARHLQRQDRVRLREPQGALPGRRGAAGLIPQYIPSWEGHHTTELFEKYPLQLLSPHPRFSFHCHYDKHTDWLDDIPVHRIKKDGYAWWPARIHPDDARARGIQQRRHRPALQRPRRRCCAAPS